MTSNLWPLVKASSSSSSASTLDPDSSDDYHEIGANAYGEPIESGHLICMVALNGDRLHNSSNIYPTIGKLEESDARTPSDDLVRNLNPNYNAIRVQAIMETIQRMAPDGPPLLSWLSKWLRGKPCHCGEVGWHSPEGTFHWRQ
jgi:hypothetical protein